MGSVIVLDLDETLLYACAKQDVKQCKHDALLWTQICNEAEKKCKEIGLQYLQTEHYFVFLRPHAIPFLQYCRENFKHMIIFTAGNQSHATFINMQLFERLAQVHVDFLLHRESCGKFAEDSVDSKTVLVAFQKNLCHLREMVTNKATPEQLQSIDWSDCIFVDDFAFHAVNNCGETLLIPKFDYACLQRLIENGSNAATMMTTAQLIEAGCDDALLKLTRFIHTKLKMQPCTTWQQIDKRFAMFQ